MKWPFIVQSTRDSHHARCNTCGYNFSVVAGGANDIISSHWYKNMKLLQMLGKGPMI